MNYVDIAVLGIIVLFIVIGFFKGFIRTVLSFAGTLIALAAGYFLAQTVANLIGGIGGLKEALGGVIEGMFKGDIFNTSIDLTDESSILAALLSLGIPEFIAEFFVPAIAQAVPAGAATETTLAGYLGPVIVNFILVIISFIVIFLIVRLVMRIIEKFVKGLLMNKTLRTGDRILGGVFGLVKAYIILCILVLLLEMMAPSVSALADIQVMLEESSLAKTISDANLVKDLWMQYVYPNLPGALSS